MPGRDAIEAVMSGWEARDAERRTASAWVRERVANAATEMGDPPADPSDDLPAH